MSKVAVMPKETNSFLKAKLNGEFSQTVIMSCGNPYCSDGHNEVTEETCEFCTGAGEYSLKVNLDWTLIKDIYQGIFEACSMTEYVIMSENLPKEFNFKKFYALIGRVPDPFVRQRLFSLSLNEVAMLYQAFYQASKETENEQKRNC